MTAQCLPYTMPHGRALKKNHPTRSRKKIAKEAAFLLYTSQEKAIKKNLNTLFYVLLLLLNIDLTNGLVTIMVHNINVQMV